MSGIFYKEDFDICYVTEGLPVSAGRNNAVWLPGDIYSNHGFSTNKLEYHVAERSITKIQTQRIGHKKELITVKNPKS